MTLNYRERYSNRPVKTTTERVHDTIVETVIERHSLKVLDRYLCIFVETVVERVIERDLVKLLEEYL